MKRGQTEEMVSDESCIGGTTPFIAPEVLRDINTQPSRKHDVYAFAVTMWEILTGQWPFSRVKSDDIIIYSVKHGMRPPIDDIIQSVGEERLIVDIMRRCWDDNPQKRPHFEGNMFGFIDKN